MGWLKCLKIGTNFVLKLLPLVPLFSEADETSLTSDLVPYILVRVNINKHFIFFGRLNSTLHCVLGYLYAVITVISARLAMS